MTLVSTEMESVCDSPLPLLLIEYLHKRFTYHSKEAWLQLIANQKISIDGKIASVFSSVLPKQKIVYQIVDYNEPDVPTHYHVLRQCEGLIFVGKAQGTPVHRTGKIFVNTLVNLLRKDFGPDWSPINRLDKETSGIVVFGADSESRQRWAPNSKNCVWLKTYVAEVSGNWEYLKKRWECRLKENPLAPIRCQMQGDDEGKLCITWIESIYHDDKRSILLLIPLTGRKHQLRAQCSLLGHPIIGDKIYSHEGQYFLKQLEMPLDDFDYQKLGSKEHRLHAVSLSLYTKNGSFIDYKNGISVIDKNIPAEFIRPLAETDVLHLAGKFSETVKHSEFNLEATWPEQ